MTTASVHDRIVTPDTDPDRWTEEEAALFRAGKCAWQVSDGGWGSGEKYCGEPSRTDPPASFGHCDRHDAEMLVEHYPDGTPRWNVDPYYDRRPEYRERLEADIAAHQRWCTDDNCECRD
jgi:hypothetical protein